MAHNRESYELIRFVGQLAHLTEYDGIMEPEQRDRVARWMDAVLPPDIAETPDELFSEKLTKAEIKAAADRAEARSKLTAQYSGNAAKDAA